MSPKQVGFTLIEILVVLVIIGIISTFAVLATGDFGASKRIEVAADTFANLVRLAEEEAILEPAVLGIGLTANGYQFYRYQLQVQMHKGQWEAITQLRILRARQLPSGSQLIVIQPKTVNQPTLVINSNGEITPFRVQFGKTQQTPLIQVEGAHNGVVKVSELATLYSK